MERKNPQITITITEQEKKDVEALSRAFGEPEARIVRNAWVKWYNSQEAQNLIERANDLLEQQKGPDQ